MPIQTIEAGKVEQFASGVKTMLDTNGKSPSFSAPCVLFAAGKCRDMIGSTSPYVPPNCMNCLDAMGDQLALVKKLAELGLVVGEPRESIDSPTLAQIRKTNISFSSRSCKVIFSHAGAPGQVDNQPYGIVTLSAQKPGRLDRWLRVG